MDSLVNRYDHLNQGPQRAGDSYQLTLPALMVAALCACGGGEATLEAGEINSTAAAISSETLGKAELASRRYGDPKIAAASYAVPTIWGCTGTMIGPNTLMSAGHCGDYDRNVTFLTYRGSHGVSPTYSTTSDSEHFACRILVNSFLRSDLALYFCAPNGAGENPGDKYGYLDFDVTQPLVGQQLYSIIAHPVGTPSLADARLWTGGKVTSTNRTIWPPPGGPITTPIGIGMSLFGEPGVSGSSTINPVNNRILVGPTSTVGSWTKNALSMRDYLTQGTIDGINGHPGYWASTLTALGLKGSDYAGGVDKDGNFLFDVQEDLERVRGENRRDWYHLGFESERRNRLWVKSSYVTFKPSSGIAQLYKPSRAGLTVLLGHQHLNLAPNRTYRVTMSLRVISSSYARNLRIGLRSPGSSAPHSWRSISTPTSGAQWKVVTTQLTTRGSGEVLEISSPYAWLFTEIKDLTLVQEGATMDFDTHDQRLGWFDQYNRRGRVLPDGRGSGPNWAGLAQRVYGASSSTEWPLRNRQMALVGGSTYRVCVDVRRNNRAYYGPTNWGILRIASAGQLVLDKTFAPTASWKTVCTGYFKAPTGDNWVGFGVSGYSWSNTVRPGYFVDNIRVTRLQLPWPLLPSSPYKTP